MSIVKQIYKCLKDEKHGEALCCFTFHVVLKKKEEAKEKERKQEHKARRN